MLVAEISVYDFAAVRKNGGERQMQSQSSWAIEKSGILGFIVPDLFSDFLPDFFSGHLPSL